MPEVIAETHCHTNACAHAYSTLYENVQEAARQGLRFLCITEHAPSMDDGPHQWFFKNIVKVVPEVLDGVAVLKGAEVNILDYQGQLDLSDEILEQLDWVIASYHIVCLEPASKAAHTEGWLAVAENPLVDVIGHCGDGRYPFDRERVVQAFAKHNKIVEINAHSFDCRPGSLENCREIALLCKKYRVPVVCSSDAHFFTQIGRVGRSLELLREIQFPEELILNTDYERFLAVAREKSNKNFI
ncbi:MAG: phosphatase [Anaerotruncus sp.]|nr:phosphatase [Anaerotruncus sp.]